MAGRIRIPWLVDIITVTAPEVIRSAASHPTLDRGFGASGPLFNRMVARRLRSTLSTGSRPLPTVLRRDDADRAAAQAALTEKLAAPEPEQLLDEETLAGLAAYVRGEGGNVGELTQQLVGRLFVKDYRATTVTWAAARHLQRAVESNNPLMLLVWVITGRLYQAQRTLSDAVMGDPAAVHSTGIAVHNLVVAMDRLAALYRDAGSRTSVGTEEAVARALVGPRTIVRQAQQHADTLVGTVTPGTLLTFAIREAGERSLDARVTFMRDSWSQCPAHRVVPAAIGAVWRQAIWR